MDKDTKQAYDWAKGTNYHSVAADYARCLALELDRIAAGRDRFKARAEAAEKDIEIMLGFQKTCFACKNCAPCKNSTTGEYSCNPKWRGAMEGANK